MRLKKIKNDPLWIRTNLISISAPHDLIRQTQEGKLNRRPRVVMMHELPHKQLCLVNWKINQMTAGVHWSKHMIGNKVCGPSRDTWLHSTLKSYYWKTKYIKSLHGVFECVSLKTMRIGLTWMRGRWMRILLVFPARCTDSFATFWSVCLKRTRCPGVLAGRAAGCPADLCG